MLKEIKFVLFLGGLDFFKLFRNGNQQDPLASYKASFFVLQGHSLCGISNIAISLLQSKACSILNRLFISLPTYYPQLANQT